MRLDLYIFSKGLAKTRTQAQNLIKMNKVAVNKVIIDKSSFDVCENDAIEISNDIRESLGCFKLRKAIDFFSLKELLADKTAIDIGASNGGFTSTLLDYGVSKVYAVDIGECAFDEALKNDGRVKIIDKTNARYMNFEVIGEKTDIIVIDVSFISLKLILPNMLQFLKNDGIIIALLKPQFEAGRENLNKSGIVTDKKIHIELINGMINFIDNLGLSVRGITAAPVLFKDKNTEYLLNIRNDREKGLTELSKENFDKLFNI